MAASVYHEKTSRKLLPILAACVPLVVAAFLIAQSSHRYRGDLVDFVSKNRSATQIVVQILSHGLGLSQTYSVHASEQLSFRLRLFQAPARLEDLAFGVALTTGRIDSLLAKLHCSITIAAVAACVIPGALWAGALTPLFVSAAVSHNSTMPIPAYTKASASIWDAEFQMEGNELWNRVQNCSGVGLITNCPVPALQGLLLSSAGSASTADGSPRLHSKNDSPQWSYVGRSYGVGASIGLSAATRGSTGSVYSLSFIEYGYATSMSCVYNTTSAYSLQLLTDTDIGPTSLSMYEAGGYLPNSFNNGIGKGTGEAYTVASSSSDDTNILAWSARAIGGDNYVSVGTGAGRYTEFNTTQCKVVFTPSTFNITANLTSKTITVTPIRRLDNVTSLLPNATITTNAMNSLNLLSRMSGTLYTSLLGDTLTRNLATIVGGDPQSALDLLNATVLGSLQDSFTAILGDVLVAYGAAQI
ncbi:hypothetical protein LTR36_008335 [Oleoguttula mirabilis]|uniref:Uncharacterized protein n=1 Tax=Oleoguttula mirabilis TaxID=1507867 RepID=A0AAV9J882_9PEZI|nr:hypothetical protein LTR36_008335 [Oleoguttula mirabilis]